MERPRPLPTGAGRVAFDGLAPGTLAWVSPVTEPAIEDKLVRSAFRHLVRSGACDPPRARDLGRVLGREMNGAPVHAFLDAFSHLGLGTLRLTAADDDRFSFAAADLPDGEKTTPSAAACALALGFAEGVAHSLTQRPALGSEMTCRSRGHAECTFSVRAKGGAGGLTPQNLETP